MKPDNVVRTMVAYLSHPVARLCLLGIVIGGGYMLLASPSGSSYSDSDTAYNASYWKGQLAHSSPESTYKLFQKRNSAAPTERQHFSAHVMGGLLAEKLGPGGIAVCDASYGFGCFHGFFAKIISTGGPELIRTLDAECVKKYGPFGTGCQHGIGHGVLEYVGYTNITKALEMCTMTTQKVPLLGCVSGVFMEYNTPLAGAEKGLTPSSRAFDAAHPYEPCTSVPSEYRASCYFELGHWFGSRTSDPDTITTLCGGLSGEPRSYCFLGVGDVTTARNTYSLAAAITFCDSFALEDQVSCRAGASWSLFASPQYRADATAACTLAGGEVSQACLALADLTKGQATQ